MRNIQFVPNKFKLRCYDLKGSTVDRNVIKDSMSEEEKKKVIDKKTMKDNDFKIVEKDGKVNINPQIAEKIANILEKDAIFFSSRMKVMDYSLLIIKVSWA